MWLKTCFPLSMMCKLRREVGGEPDAWLRRQGCGRAMSFCRICVCLPFWAVIVLFTWRCTNLKSICIKQINISSVATRKHLRNKNGNEVLIRKGDLYCMLGLKIRSSEPDSNMWVIFKLLKLSLHVSVVIFLPICRPYSTSFVSLTT